MSDGSFRERWVSAVFRTPHVTDSVRVALLALAQDMDESGSVSIRRDELASRLGRSDRRIGDRLKEAIEAGFLQRVTRGQRNGAGRYQATTPDPSSSGLPGVPKKTDLLRTPGGPEDGSLQDGLQPEENGRLEDTRGSRREHSDPGVLRTPGGPEEDKRTYKDPARAHSNGDPSTHTRRDGAHADGAIVVDLFGEKAPSLRSQKPAERKRAAAGSRDEHPAFAEWYAVYPLHAARGAAVKAFNKAVKKVGDPAILIAGAERYRDHDPRVKRGYIANPATWLNQERWLDGTIPDPAANARASGDYQPYRNPEDHSDYDEDF